MGDELPDKQAYRIFTRGMERRTAIARVVSVDDQRQVEWTLSGFEFCSPEAPRSTEHMGRSGVTGGSGVASTDCLNELDAFADYR
jgi:hypothetical protein